MTYLTVPIAAKTVAKAGQQARQAVKAGAEMLELRVDYLEDLNVTKLKKLILLARSTKKDIPIIVTCRDKKQGGVIDYPIKVRMEILLAAINGGAEYIDFEYENFIMSPNSEIFKKALSENKKSKLILSAHNFETKFPDINKLYKQIKTVYKNAIPKLVYTATHINDCFDAFDLLHKTKGERIIFCMGQAGLISRIIAKKLGSLVTFASIDETMATAPGQVAIERFKNLYRFDSINDKTKLYGVIANPVGHSLSPHVHNACFTKAKLNNIYLPLLVQGDTKEFNKFMDNILSRPWLDFKGFSITIPHKENALNYVKKHKGLVEPLAEKIGAANTIIIESRTTNHKPLLSAYNTDYKAAIESIISSMRIGKSGLKNMSVAVIGAGGVSRAIVAGLSEAGAKIKIYNRTIERAKELAGDFNCEFGSLDELKNLDAKLLINCTSIGMYPNVNAMPVPKDCLKKERIVFDTVYNPIETMLLKEAKKKGAKTIDGVSMFVNQAAAQFKLFTGKQADTKLMRKVIEGNLKFKT